MLKILEEFKVQSARVIDTFKKEAAAVRANRPNSALVENIKVSYYDQTLPLKQLCSITVIPPREIQLQVWDKEAVQNVAKAIESSSLGISASAEGNILRIHLPELSRERRDELIKHVKQITEQHKIQLRHLRDETNKRIQKSFDGHEVNEDQKFKLKEEIQKETGKTNEEIEKILANKIKEIND